MNTVRFAPSPTGNVHIGNIRTAIFNWLFARHTNGKFLLRVEDTDKERSTKEAIDKLFECMKWLGLDYDGEIFYQSSREEFHKEAGKKLLKEQKAYRPEKKEEDLVVPVIFRIPWDSETCTNVRIVGNVELTVCADEIIGISREGVKFSYLNDKGRKVENFFSLAGYRHLKLYDTEGKLVFDIEEHTEELLTGKQKFALSNCNKMNYEKREVFYKDLIKGELSKPLDSMKDFVILRSDDSPVFHLANVCDDIEQKITHIIRGDDHVENTYKHIFLFDALNYPIPSYAHMPMILNQSGKPYSKRDGDAFVGDFREKGYLPEALFNYLSLLGWSPGDNREKMSKRDMIEAFTLDRVKSAPAQFDVIKLQNMNGLYIAEMDDNSFMELAYHETLKQGWGIALDKDLFDKVAILMKSRTKILSQVSNWKYFFFDESLPLSEYENSNLSLQSFSYDEKALRKAFKDQIYIDGIIRFKENLSSREVHCQGCVESTIRESEKQCSLGEGKLNQVLRVTVTGMTSGADLVETIFIIGKERVCKRIEKLLKVLTK